VKRINLLLLIAVGACTVIGMPGASSTACAQQAAGAIAGTVVDPAGAAVVNATVTVRDVDRGTTWVTKTSESGLYEFPQIPVGNVTVSVEAQGFSVEVRNAFNLILNQVAKVDFQMKLGKVSETVGVDSAPPLLQTASTEIGTLIDANAATSLPLASRDINQLTLLAPGVISPNIFAFQSAQTTFGTGRPYVNGAREQDNNFSLDGMDVNQADNNEVAYVPGPDAIQEFNLIASNAPADYGNYIGGVIVESLKSGTNHYHGDLFEFVRNTDLNANSWQNKAQNAFFGYQPGNPNYAPRNPLQWNEFGGTVGGPILKNKLFFFVDEQSSRFNTPANTISYSPIPAAYRTGDFSSLCTSGFVGGVCTTAAQQLYDPSTGGGVTAARSPFPNNQVPIRSASAGKILALPGFPAASVTSYIQHSYTNSYQGDAKIDWQASQNDHVMGRYSQMYTINNQTNSIELLPSLTREYPLKNFVVDYVRTLTPSLVNDARAGAQIFPANDQKYTNPTGQNLPAEAGIPGVQDTILPALNWTAGNGGPLLYSIGNGDSVEIFHDTTYQLEDSLTWTHGKHVFHGGFEWYHYIMNDVYPGNAGVAGTFTFTGQFTGNSTTGTTGGEPVADFLLGLPEDVQEGTPYRFHLRNSLFGAFLQDTFRATPSLTLNLGLRYELTTPRGDSTSANNVNFDKVSGTPEIGTNYNTYTGIDNLQPRIGFAWQPDFAPNTVIRGAYDISTYMEGNGVNNLADQNPPHVVNHEEVNAGLAAPATTLDQGYASFPSAACTATGLQAYSAACLSGIQIHETNPNLQPAVDQQWNVVVQHQFKANSTASIGYVGNKIDHMSDLFLWNQLVLNASDHAVAGPFSQPLVNAGAQTRYNDSSAISRYEALELTFAQRNFHGLDTQLSYTWSKCLSNSLGYFGQYGDEEGTGQSQTNGGYFFFQNVYNPKADYGRCITDLAQAFTGYAVYDLPFGKGRTFGPNVNAVVDEVIGGWQVAPNVTFHSGFAIDPSAPDQSGTGGGASFAYRPNCPSGVSMSGSDQFEDIAGSLGKQFINPLVVTKPALGTFGNCQVGALRGPGLKTADINLTKRFPITEKTNLQFMAQFLNFTNSPIFGAPSAGCNQCNGVLTTGPTGGGAGTVGNFGEVQSQDPGRQIQFALKLNF
jgi:hypothetical protein